MKTIPNAQQPPAEPADGALKLSDQDKAWSGLGEARERAVPPMTKAQSAALSARSDGFDDIDGSPECGVYTQMCGVEQVRVGRRF